MDSEWQWSEQKTINVTDEEKHLFESLADRIYNLGAANYSELGICTVRKHRIMLASDVPVYQAPFRPAETDRPLLEKEIDELLSAGIIRRSTSRYGSTAFFVGKKGGSKRLVVNYKPLNSIMYQLHWPIPLVQDLLDRMSKSVIFTKLDLKSGYYQIPMDEDSIQFTAFTTTIGHYEFTRMPFGLKNAPAEFCQIMYDVLGD